MPDSDVSVARSAIMRSVRQKDTAPEMAVRRIVYAIGGRYRLHRKDLPGSPDLVFPRHHLCIFVHGCFWHRHPDCPKASFPKTRPDFWARKFSANVVRDAEKAAALEALGWKVLVVWECETLPRNRYALALRLAEQLGIPETLVKQRLNNHPEVLLQLHVRRHERVS